jgi:hypothetical protein
VNTNETPETNDNENAGMTEAELELFDRWLAQAIESGTVVEVERETKAPTKWADPQEKVDAFTAENPTLNITSVFEEFNDSAPYAWGMVHFALDSIRSERNLTAVVAKLRQQGHSLASRYPGGTDDLDEIIAALVLDAQDQFLDRHPKSPSWPTS